MADPQAPTAASPAAALSDTELEILRLVATGATNREIAHARTISEATVKKHLTNINAKLGTANRTEAMRRALDTGLIALGDPSDGGPDGGGGDEDVRRNDGGAAARLAEELSRTRQRARRTVMLTLGGAALTVLAILGAATWRLTHGTATPTPPPTAAAPAPQDWVLGRQLPEARTGLAAVAAGADLFVIAGATDGGRLVSTTLQYAGGGGLDWRVRASKPTAVRDVAGVAVQGKIIVPGGCAADGRATGVVEIFDPRTDAWRTAAPLPAGRAVCGYGLAMLDGQVYLFGGRTDDDPSSATDAILRYDWSTDAWTVEPDRLLRPRADLAAAAFEGRIHVVGGRSPGGKPENNHWVFRPFEPSADRWDETAAPLPDARAGHALAVANVSGERLYVVGGGWNTHLDVGTLAYDLERGAWSEFAVVRGYTPDRGAGLAVLARQQLVLVGGQRLSGEPLRQTYLRPLKYEIVLPTGGQR